MSYAKNMHNNALENNMKDYQNLKKKEYKKFTLSVFPKLNRQIMEGKNNYGKI
jgi:hypothetical protein